MSQTMPYQKKIKSRTVCVIEPRPATCLQLKIYFETFGAKVFTVSHFDKVANTLEGAIKSGTPVDLILVEPRFPETSGLDMLKEIQSVLHHVEVPIFVLSNGHSQSEMASMVRWGVKGYLRKPKKIEAIGKFIYQHL
jgi:DNA-binding response OmpR family regulator